MSSKPPTIPNLPKTTCPQCSARISSAARKCPWCKAVQPDHPARPPRVAVVATEWGARRPDLASGVFNAGSDEDAEKMARLIAGDQERRGIKGALLRRTVTYGSWEEVPDPANNFNNHRD